MDFLLALVIGVGVGVVVALLAVSLLEAVGVALSSWLDQGEDDL